MSLILTYITKIISRYFSSCEAKTTVTSLVNFMLTENKAVSSRWFIYGVRFNPPRLHPVADLSIYGSINWAITIPMSTFWGNGIIVLGWAASWGKNSVVFWTDANGNKNCINIMQIHASFRHCKNIILRRSRHVWK